MLRGAWGAHREWVFTWRGKPVFHVVTKAWQAACLRAGVDGLRFHDLRHTWASWHAQAGTPLPVLQQLGGWRTFDMVLVCAHLAPNHLRAAAARLRPPESRQTGDIPEDTIAC